MNEMIERVAKAIGTKVMGEQSINLNEAAKAAIAAMREPTPDMNIAGGIAWSNALPKAGTYVDNAAAGYQAMIDAALKE